MANLGRPHQHNNNVLHLFVYWYMSITCECDITMFGNQYTNTALYRVLYFTARTEGYFNPAKDILFAAISEIGKLGS